jgi:hypothetical protein
MIPLVEEYFSRKMSIFRVVLFIALMMKAISTSEVSNHPPQYTAHLHT